MRRSTVSALVAAQLVAAATGVALASSNVASAAAADPYTWNNVRIDGGGFVPDIVFNPGEKNLVYARTDVGGAYRWNESSQSWTSLLDFVGRDNWGYNGVLSIAADPVDTKRVYAAVGMYTNSWDPNRGAILRSTDKGETWQVSTLPFKNGAAMPGRGMGERLAVDPRNNRNVYFAAEGGNGLWRSTDYGVTWAKVTKFPNIGNYVQDRTDDSGYLSQNQGLTWVTFGAPNQIFVGVADKANPVYSSDDNGATWERIPSQPTGYLPHKGVVQGKYLYITTSDTGGPYDGAKGQVHRLDTTLGSWADISPVPVAKASSGYSGLTVDAQHPGTLMVASQVSWWPETVFFRSTDYGATWTRIWDWTTYPNRSKRYKLDIAANPWLSLNRNPAPPESSPTLGSMTAGLAIDPFNSDRLFYGTETTIYQTTQLTNWDKNTTFTVKPAAKGLEESSVLDLASPPSGAPLVSALRDVGGFHHGSLDAVPANLHDTPSLSSNTSLDFAELQPSVFARVGSTDSGPNIGISTDGGKTWTPGQEPAGVTDGGTIAVGADAASMVWSPAGARVHHSTNRGRSWTASTGIPAGAVVESDRVNPKTFYGYAGGKFYTSKDGGVTFTASSAAMPSSAPKFHAVPGNAGHVWLAGTTGLLRSTDAGATFKPMPSVTSAVNVAFGKAAPGATHPTVFLVGTVSGVEGVFRSDNTGTSWVRINDDAHQYGRAGDALAGDPRVYGRVYLGTTGRGILYADRQNAPTPTPTVSTSPTTSPTPTPSPTPPSSGCVASYEIAARWEGGFRGEVTVQNTGTVATKGWTVKWTFGAGQVVIKTWEGTATQSGAAVTVTNGSENSAVPPKGTARFGFSASQPSASNPIPSPISCTPTT